MLTPLRKVAAVAAAAALSGAALSITAAAPAAAGSYECIAARPTNTTYAYLSFSRCSVQSGSQTWSFVKGTLKDKKGADTCYSEVKFVFQGTEVSFTAREQTEKFETDSKHANRFSYSLTRHC